MAEDVAEAFGIDPVGIEGRKERVACAEAYDGDAGAERSGSDEAGGIVSGPNGDRGPGPEAEFGKVGGEPACHAVFGGHRRELRDKAWRGGFGNFRIPGERVQVEQVHSSAVASIDRGISADEDRA